MSAKRIQPFKFDNLEQLTRQQVDLHAGVLRYLPRVLPANAFVEQIVSQMQRYMGDPVQLELTALREPKFEKYCSTVPDPAILFLFSCIPLQQKAFLQIDFALAHILVDRMLGGSGEHYQELRPITSIEEGVLQFLVLKILTILADAVEGSDIQFRFDRMLSDSAELKDYGDDEDLLALLSIQITVGKKAGFVRLALPHPLVDGILAALAPQERQITLSELRRLERVCDIKMPIWVELGRVDIGHVDLSALEAGDVVLLEEVFVNIGAQGVEGDVTLRVHDGVGGGFQGAIVESRDDGIAIEIQGAF